MKGFDLKLTSTLLILGLVLAGTSAYSEKNLNLEMGIEYYGKRYSKDPSHRCHPENVLKSIQYFEKAIAEKSSREEAGQHLLWAYYYKGMFLCTGDQDKRKEYDKGKKLGEKLMKEFPDNVDIKFGYVANTGKWSEINGMFASAYDGVGGKIRDALEDALSINPDFENGLGYRLLALLNYKAPNVPIIMPWPCKEKAFELAKKAKSMAPDNIGNNLTLGELYYWSGDYEKARTIFSFMQSLNPRPNHYTLDQYEIQKAANYLNKIDSELIQTRNSR